VCVCVRHCHASGTSVPNCIYRARLTQYYQTKVSRVRVLSTSLLALRFYLNAYNSVCVGDVQLFARASDGFNARECICASKQKKNSASRLVQT